MAEKKRILIINFSFPPSPGIGGRRWAKFAKYLQRHGHRVFVIAAQNDSPAVSDWVQDVRGLNVTYLPTHQPKIFSRSATSFADRIRFRLATLWVKFRIRGNYYDRSSLMRGELQRTVRSIINKEKIETLIISGAPFRHLSHVMELKSEFPKVKFMLDFRDVWTTDDSISNFKHLSSKRFQFEKEQERKVVNLAQHVIAVAPAIRDYFAGLSQNPAQSFDTLENGYDPDDFENVSASVQKESSTDAIRIVFTGNFYPETENLWHPFVEMLAGLKKSAPETYARLQLDFYGRMQSSYLDFAKVRGVDCIHFHGQVSLHDVYQHIRHSTYCLLILHDLFAFSLSTKFCEYVSQHKKILVLSKAGETAQFVTGKNLGYWINPDAMRDSFLNVISEWDNGNAQRWEPGMDISYYSLESLTQKLEQWL